MTKKLIRKMATLAGATCVQYLPRGMR